MKLGLLFVALITASLGLSPLAALAEQDEDSCAELLKDPNPLQWGALSPIQAGALASLIGVKSERIQAIFDASTATERNSLVDALPDIEIEGEITFSELQYPKSPDLNVAPGGSELNSLLPKIGNYFLIPVAMTNGYDNFSALTYLEPSQILPMRFRSIPAGTKLHIKGKKNVLMTKLFSRFGRTIGPAILVNEVQFENGHRVTLTDKFAGPKSTQTPSSNQDDLFYVIGSNQKPYNPLTGRMANGIRNLVSDTIQKRRLLTAYLTFRDNEGYPAIGYRAKPAPGNPWDPNWSFRFDRIEFHRPGMQGSEFYDGSFEHLESSYLADIREMHWDLTAKFYEPWGGENQILDIQNSQGRPLSRDEVEELLNQLGGPDPSML